MNRRSWFSLILLGNILLFGLIGFVMVFGYTFPQPNLQNLGPVSNYPPSETPYYVPGTVPVFVVHTGENMIVLAAIPPHPNACLMRWISEDEKFMDPCLGSQFRRDGTYILGPPPRNMDQYEFKIENGDLWVDVDRKILGEPHP